GSHAWDTAN
nr:Chain A, integrin beta3